MCFFLKSTQVIVIFFYMYIKLISHIIYSLNIFITLFLKIDKIQYQFIFFIVK